MTERFNQLINICQPLGEELLTLQHHGYTTEIKADQSPVTEADLLAHRTLVKELAQLDDLPIVSEEDVPEDTQMLSYWLIDPIDGTKEFIAGTDQFTIHIAQIINGEAVMGFVYVPGQYIAYAAMKGGRAYKWSRGEWHHIQANTRTNNLISVESRLHKSSQDADILAEYDIHSHRELGSSLKILAIAEGSADIYVRTIPTKIWDTVPPQVILQAAGGDILDLEGRSLGFSLDHLVNPSIKSVNAGLLAQNNLSRQ